MSKKTSPARETFEPGDDAAFLRDLSAPGPVPEEGITRAIEIMRHGTLFRYGEDRDGTADVALFEEEFAQYLGASYAVGLNSCGCAIFVSLKSLGVAHEEPVLLNAFTLAPVPGAIAHAGAEPILVDTCEDLTIDLTDLERKAKDTGARVLVLSHMRGHVTDMDAAFETCRRLGLLMVEDCAHTLGARWNGRLVGTFGKVACFSTQTFKHLNSGEGGVLVTNDDEVAARAILHSGSYMLYPQHRARPPLHVFDRFKLETPNFSMRMSALTAAILRPQLRQLDARCKLWTDAYLRLADQICAVPGLSVPERDPNEQFVGSSIQFIVSGLSSAELSRFIDACDTRGVHIKWFGRAEPKGFTAQYKAWQYVGQDTSLPRTDAILDRLCDMRVPSDLDDEDCRAITNVMHLAIGEAHGTTTSPGHRRSNT